MYIDILLYNFLFMLFKNIITYSSYCSAIVLLLTLFYTIYKAITFKKNINNDSLKKISVLKTNKKYIKDVFIELGKIKETIRYFIHERKYLKRIVREFNNLSSTTFAQIVSKLPSEKKIKFNIGVFKCFVIKINTLVRIIQDVLIYVDRVNKEQHAQYVNSIGDIVYKIQTVSYPVERKLKLLKDYVYASKAKVLLYKGVAGCGKTNLLCNVTEQVIIPYNHIAMFINGRDIKNSNITKYFYNKLFSDSKMLKIKFYITNLFLIVTCKRMFIVIDAINENDDEEFPKQLVSFIESIIKFRNIRILISSRSEYFEYRFGEAFNNSTIINENIYIINDNKRYELSNETKEKLFKIYSRHFNFTGVVERSCLDQLLDSLILLRVFFEVFSNSSEHIFHLNKFQIYKSYIEKIEHSYPNINLNYYIDKISEKMINTNNYDNVEIREFEENELDFRTLKCIIDENILLHRQLILNENSILEQKVEVVSFTFDELRDFVIARNLLKNKDINDLINFIVNMSKKKLSPLEGIIRYIYLHFKEIKDYEKAKIFFDSEIFSYTNYVCMKYVHSDTKEYFDDFKLQLIFELPDNKLENYELDYVMDKLLMESDNLRDKRIIMKKVLFRSIYSDHYKKLNFKFLTNYIKQCDEKEYNSIIVHTFKPKSRYYSIYDKDNFLRNYIDKVSYILKKKGIKQQIYMYEFLIILCGSKDQYGNSYNHAKETLIQVSGSNYQLSKKIINEVKESIAIDRIKRILSEVEVRLDKNDLCI